ncbi:hypothetical protein PMY56_10180 [Clostridium tertium]|uniref:hypothetical protein n=1 Tax=Clostridium TaxID=1485 RepID=UPI0023306062|nr:MULTISPECIES: hypothetical protein [Clostridium]MDB1922105.1 hypothetical protein [Clostridium tertium]MDB1926508.1 hypothetical protein [Clostridium tertium]MDB1929683.1 hypothetical protein [Clostridium tertium]MDU3548770.1 hypothetical protein [Clostridium sp.]MDU4737274.1 hypothetical protein [Clostridium sp.]
MCIIYQEDMIDAIPRFESSDGRKCELSDEFIKNKLKQALYNSNIINLSRGEGRSNMINEIVFHPEILFDWGQKSMHAYLDSKDEILSNFYDPEVVDKDLIIVYINKYADELERFIHNYRELRSNYDENSRIEKLKKDVIREDDNQSLLIIKEWLIFAFHTMGIKEFAEISPCISCSYGDNRFEIAKRFGSNRSRNPYYVLMDCWVRKHDEGITFRRTEYINEKLKYYGLKWFPNHNSEIMLKYAIFPQQLVGYYLFDRGELIKYVVNKNYLNEWEKDVNFYIGDNIYFDQYINFNKLGPYNTVYKYLNGRYSIASRRWYK